MALHATSLIRVSRWHAIGMAARDCRSVNTGRYTVCCDAGNGVDETAVEGAADTDYDIPKFHCSVHHPEVNVPVLWWRSVGHTHTAFVMETLVEELAIRANADPIAYPRKLLKAEAKKSRAVLDLLEAKSAWRNSLAQGHA